jgi:hypothetical protein
MRGRCNPWVKNPRLKSGVATRRAWEHGCPARIGPDGNRGITVVRGLKPTAKSTVATRRWGMCGTVPWGGNPWTWLLIGRCNCMFAA